MRRSNSEEARLSRRQLLASGLVSLAAAPATARGALPARRVRFVAIGDSITRGVGASDPQEKGFVAQLARRFPEFDVVSAGCNGSTVRDWTTANPYVGLDRCHIANAWPALGEPTLPAHIFHVMFGTNDVTGIFERISRRLGDHGNFVPPAEFEVRLRGLIDRLDGLVLLSTPPLPRMFQGPPFAQRLAAYRDGVAKIVSDRPDVVLGGDFLGLLDFSDMLDVHPNDVGHERMADEIERTLLGLFSRGRSGRARAITPWRVYHARIGLHREFAARRARRTRRRRAASALARLASVLDP